MISISKLKKMSEKERGDYLENLRRTIDAAKIDERICVEAASMGMVFNGYIYVPSSERLAWIQEEAATKILESHVDRIETIMKLATPSQIIKIKGEEFRNIINPLVKATPTSPYLRVA